MNSPKVSFKSKPNSPTASAKLSQVLRQSVNTKNIPPTKTVSQKELQEQFLRSLERPMERYNSNELEELADKLLTQFRKKRFNSIHSDLLGKAKHYFENNFSQEIKSPKEMQALRKIRKVNSTEVTLPEIHTALIDGIRRDDYKTEGNADDKDAVKDLDNWLRFKTKSGVIKVETELSDSRPNSRAILHSRHNRHLGHLGQIRSHSPRVNTPKRNSSRSGTPSRLAVNGVHENVYKKSSFLRDKRTTVKNVDLTLKIPKEKWSLGGEGIRQNNELPPIRAAFRMRS